MPLYAEIDDTNTVQRVVVAPLITWVRTNLPAADGGRWVRTTSDLASDQYPGPGWAYDPAAQTFTAPQVEPVPEPET